jgi:hypothetical protein
VIAVKGKVALIGGAILVVLALALLWPRRVSPEEQVRREVIEMVRQAEGRELGDFMDHVSTRFQGGHGMDRDGLKQTMAAMLLRDRWLRIFLIGVDVTPNSDGTMGVVAKVIFARSKTDELSKLAAESVFGAYEVTGTFAKEQDGSWRATTGHEREIDPKGLLAPPPLP